MQYTVAEHDAFADVFNRDGLVLLKRHFPRDKLARWREAFQPLFEAQIENDRDDPNRGLQRFYAQASERIDELQEKTGRGLAQP